MAGAAAAGGTLIYLLLLKRTFYKKKHFLSSEKGCWWPRVGGLASEGQGAASSDGWHRACRQPGGREGMEGSAEGKKGAFRGVGAVLPRWPHSG